MKITSVKAIPIKTGSLLVRVNTDEGIEGVGECSNRNWRSLKPFIEDDCGSIVVGMDPRDTQRLWDMMFPPSKWLGPGGFQLTGMAAIDMACWDIAGKSRDQPLYQMLGGAARTRIPLYWSTGLGWKGWRQGGGDPGSPEELVEAMREGLEAGFTAFKLRLEWMHHRQDRDPAGDIERFRACRRLVGDGCRLSVNANNGYTVSTAIEQGKRFEDLGATHLEEPLPQYDYLGLKQVVDALDVPVSSGELENTLWDFRDLILTGDPDIVQPDLALTGGVTGMSKVFMLCEAFNKPVLPHAPGAGIQNTVTLHLYATQVNATLPHEYTWAFAGSLGSATGIFEEPLIPKDGYIQLSDRPGHGLVLNEDAVNAVAIDE